MTAMTKKNHGPSPTDLLEALRIAVAPNEDGDSDVRFQLLAFIEDLSEDLDDVSWELLEAHSTEEFSPHTLYNVGRLNALDYKVKAAITYFHHVLYDKGIFTDTDKPKRMKRAAEVTQ